MSNPIDFELYRSNVPTMQNPAPLVPKQPIDFEQYKVEEPESVLGKAGRYITTTAARTGELLGGFGGNIRDIAGDLAIGAVKKFGPQGFGEELEKAREKSRQTPFYKRGMLPSSEDLRKVTKELTGGYTEPKNETEEKYTQRTADALQILKGDVPSFLRAIGMFGLREGVEQTANLAGASDKTKAALDFGATLFSTLADPTKMDKYYKGLRRQAERAMPGIDLNFSNAESKLKILKQSLLRQGSTLKSHPVVKAIDDVLEKVGPEGRILLGDAVKLKTGINGTINSLAKGDLEKLQGSKRLLLNLNKLLTRNIATARNKAPDWYNLYRTSELGHAGVRQSKKVSDFISGIVHKNPAKLAGAAVYYGVQDPSLAAKAAAGAAGTFGALKSYEFYKRFKNPTIRKYYLRAFKSALDENKELTTKNLLNLQRALDMQKSILKEEE